MYWRFLICYEVLKDVLARSPIPVTETDKLHASCFGALFSFQSLFRRWTHSAERTAFPIPSHPSFLLRPKLSSGEGDKTEEKLSRKKGGERGRVRMDEGGNVWRPLPLVQPPSSPPLCVPTDGGLITRAADLKLSVPLSQPTDQPAAFGRSTKRS